MKQHRGGDTTTIRPNFHLYFLWSGNVAAVDTFRLVTSIHDVHDDLLR